MDNGKLIELLVDILMHSCGQLSEAEKLEMNEGFQSYRIDVHCVTFLVNAKYHAEEDYWEVRDWTKQDS